MEDNAPTCTTHCYMAKAHGSLMITAWVFLSGFAIFMPRYFRSVFRRQLFCSKEAWLVIHATMMTLALSCIVVGVIVIFTMNNWTWMTYGPQDPQYFHAHAPIGLTILLLVVVNPILALCRCDPDSPNRPAFNWAHFLIGTCAQILAGINMCFGIKIGESESFFDSTVFWVMIAFLGFHICIEFFLLLNKYCGRPPKYNLKLADEEPQQKSRGRLTMDFVLLGAYVLIVLGLWLTLIILIATTT